MVDPSTPFKVMYVFDTSGNVVSSYGNCLFEEPFAIFIDSLDNSYIVDQQGSSILVFNDNGNFIRQIFAPSLRLNEVVVLPDCEMWVTAGGDIFIYG